MFNPLHVIAYQLNFTESEIFAIHMYCILQQRFLFKTDTSDTHMLINANEYRINS